MQKQLETVEKVSNSETHMKLCPKHSKAALDGAERKRVRWWKKEHQKTSSQWCVIFLRNGEGMFNCIFSCVLLKESVNHEVRLNCCH